MNSLYLTRLSMAAAALAGLAACGPRPASAPHWGYEAAEGPAHWSAIAPACAGSTQSPIDLHSNTVEHTDHSHLQLHYAPAHFRVVNNGHTIQADPMDAPGSGIDLDGEHFELKQFHVHTPSEHQIDGRSHDMELHLVHVSASGRTAVVAAFYDVGKDSPALAEMFNDMRSVLTRPGSSLRLDQSIDPGALVPRHGHVARYTGSLTTPPCTEGVLWNLELQPMQLSAAQLQALRHLYPHNNRPVQPVNGRRIEEQPT